MRERIRWVGGLAFCIRGRVSSRSRLVLVILTVIAPSGASSTALTLSLGTKVLVEIDEWKWTPFSSMPAITEGMTSPLRRIQTRGDSSPGVVGAFEGDSARAWANLRAMPAAPAGASRRAAARADAGITSL